jgi:hypothetical protein
VLHWSGRIATGPLPFVDHQFPAAGAEPFIALIGEAPGADEVRIGQAAMDSCPRRMFWPAPAFNTVKNRPFVVT